MASETIDRSQERIGKMLGASFLTIGALVLSIVVLPVGYHAFRGPQVVTSEELLKAGPPGWFDNYVRHKPSEPIVDTGWVYGIKGNAGTKFVVVRLGEESLLCSLRVADSPSELIGRLETMSGDEERVIKEFLKQPGEADSKFRPFYLQSVRSIWVDLTLFLLGIVACGGWGGWLFTETLILWQPPKRHRRTRSRRRRRREQFEDEVDDEF